MVYGRRGYLWGGGGLRVHLYVMKPVFIVSGKQRKRDFPFPCKKGRKKNVRDLNSRFLNLERFEVSREWSICWIACKTVVIRKISKVKENSNKQLKYIRNNDPSYTSKWQKGTK